MPKTIDFTGEKIGHLTVLSFSHLRNRDKAKVWNCQCKCGKTFKRVINRRTILKRKFCKFCKPILSGPKHGSWKAEGEISGRIFALIKCSAKVKGLEFNLTKKDLAELFTKQGGRCALSGEEISINSSIRKGSSKGTASLDRINSSIGYVIGNIQWLHRDVNLMKRDLSEDRFIEYCNKISSLKRKE